MTYVMSDIHGEHDRFKAMLQEIQFSDKDTLYILGDMIDYGPDSIAVVQDVMSRKNIQAFRRTSKRPLFQRCSESCGRALAGQSVPKRIPVLSAFWISGQRRKGGTIRLYRMHCRRCR